MSEKEKENKIPVRPEAGEGGEGKVVIDNKGVRWLFLLVALLLLTPFVKLIEIVFPAERFAPEPSVPAVVETVADSSGLIRPLQSNNLDSLNGAFKNYCPPFSN